MQFFGAFMLLVLPLFLIVSAKAIDNNSNLKNSGAGKIMKAVFYLFAAMAFLGFIILFLAILNDV